MDPIRLFIDEKEIECSSGSTILIAAQANDIYIPTLCYHPALSANRKLAPDAHIFRGTERIVSDSQETFPGCRLCLVQIKGSPDLVTACDTLVTAGMKVITRSSEIDKARKENLSDILARHPHECLLCVEQKLCDATQCSHEVAAVERCCFQLGKCELQKVARYIGIPSDIPKYVFKSLPTFEKDPLYKLDFNLCIGCLRCVRVCSEVRQVNALGFAKKGGEIFVGTKAPTLADSGCRFCMACVEVCPTGAILEKDAEPGEKAKAEIPCEHACPVGIDVPACLRYVAAGDYDEALAVILEKTPFPNSLGHVCFHPCESACRRKRVNGEPIAICGMEWFAGAKGDGKWIEKLPKRTPTGKTVAIIGAGPGGLEAAYLLAVKGHDVTIFDKEEEAGGALRYTVPEYRLPKSVLDEDLKYIRQLGVKFEGGRQVSVKDVVAKFDAVLIASGNAVPRKLRIDGAEMAGVHWALDFLRSIRRGEDVKLTGSVLVIGGGSMAVDAALSAKRTGANRVTMVCIERPEEMPARQWEIDQAIDEGVEVHTSWGPRVVRGAVGAENDRRSSLAGSGYSLTGKKIERRSSGKVSGVEFMRCVSAFDENKHFNPQYDDCEIQHFDADTVIFAIGHVSHADFIDIDGVKTERGLVKVNSDLMTGKAGVFACGEVVLPNASMIDAIGHGREAASKIDKYLGGNGDISFTLCDKKAPDPKIGRREGFAKEGRIPMRKLPLARRNDFSLVNLGYGEDAARTEASRCLQCDLRRDIPSVVLPPAGDDVS